MAFYWSLWGFVLLFTLTWRQKTNNKVYYYWLLFFFFILAVLTGGRDSVGSDWGSYKALYDFGVSGGNQHIEDIEPVYRVLIKIFKSLGFSYGLFCAFISFLTLWAFLRALELAKVKNYWFAFLVYLSLDFCAYHFNFVRHGSMTSFVLLGIVYAARYYNTKTDSKSKGGGKHIYRDLFMSIICILIGSGFHRTGLMFLLLIPIICKRFNKVTIGIIALFTIFFSLLKANDVVGLIMNYIFESSSVEQYLDTDRGVNSPLSIGTLGKVAIFIYSYFYAHQLYDDNTFFRAFVNLLLLAVLFCVGFSAYDIVIERLGSTLSLSLAFVLPYLSYYSFKGRVKPIANVLILLYLGLYYSKSFLETHMIPFVFDFSNLIN